MTVFRSFARMSDHTFLADHLTAESVVVDLGAHRGEFAPAVHSAFGCPVVTVEPVPELAGHLRTLRLGPVHQAAVGGPDGATLHLFAHRCASLYHTGADPRASAATIPVVRLTLRDLCDARIQLLKVDIEGAELDLFEEMTAEDYSRIDQITVEFHDFLYPETRPRVLAAMARIESHGFVHIAFSLDHTDVLFVNREACRLTRMLHFTAASLQKYACGASRRCQRLIGAGPPAPTAAEGPRP